MNYIDILITIVGITTQKNCRPFFCVLILIKIYGQNVNIFVFNLINSTLRLNKQTIHISKD